MTSRRPAKYVEMGLATILGWRRQGYFLPYRYADQVTDPATAPGYPALLPWFVGAGPQMTALLQHMAALSVDLSAIGGGGPQADRARWDQEWFPRLDAAALYTIIRTRHPQRMIEVGSGHSTRFMVRAICDGGLATLLTCIDPAPRADIAGLTLTLHRQTVQSVDRAVFASLVAGDILFIDSSHLLVAGSDVDVLLNDILPRLPSGVLVHIHDIVLPNAYPAVWGWRGYNEQQAVAPLIHGGGWRILWSSPWVAAHLAGEVPQVIRSLPLSQSAMETSLWLIKN